MSKTKHQPRQQKPLSMAALGMCTCVHVCITLPHMHDRCVICSRLEEMGESRCAKQILAEELAKPESPEDVAMLMGPALLSKTGRTADEIITFVEETLLMPLLPWQAEVLRRIFP